MVHFLNIMVKKLGTIGDIGCFSFFSNKNISTGEGGMLVCNNEDYYNKAKLLHSHGMTSLSFDRAKGHSINYDVVGLGYNYRLDDIRASIGIVQLDKLNEDLNKRIKIRHLYENHLRNNSNIIIPFQNYAEFSSNYIFPIILNNSSYGKRDYIREKLAESGIQTSVHYPAVHKFSLFKPYSTKLEKTAYISDNLISLPMYSKLEEEQINYISKVLNGLLK
jgi:dTDP-4-amino-4,6-dideoxygalactose transaminase